MVMTSWLQPGWTLESSTSENYDPVTGEPRATYTTTVGRGLIQEPSWVQDREVTSQSAIDERLMMFTPTMTPIEAVDVSAADQFFSPEGKCWQAITDGRFRGIPGQTPDYIATRVRRAKEKDR